VRIRKKGKIEQPTAYGITPPKGKRTVIHRPAPDEAVVGVEVALGETDADLEEEKKNQQRRGKQHVLVRIRTKSKVFLDQ